MWTIEIWRGVWQRCEADGQEYRAETREEAEAEAAFAFCNSERYRVVEVET